MEHFGFFIVPDGIISSCPMFERYTYHLQLLILGSSD